MLKTFNYSKRYNHQQANDYFCIMMKRLILTLAFFIAALTFISAQYYYGGISSSMAFPRTSYSIDSSGRLSFTPGDMGVTMQLGAGYSSFSGYGSMFTTYASPAFAYNVSKRFRIKAGFSVYNTFGGSNAGSQESVVALAPAMGTSVFVQGDYLVNNKLMLSGTYYRTISPFNPAVTDPRLKAPENQGMSFNMNYRPSERFEINVGINYSNGNNPYGYSPFYNPYMSAPGFGHPW